MIHGARASTACLEPHRDEQAVTETEVLNSIDSRDHSPRRCQDIVQEIDIPGHPIWRRTWLERTLPLGDAIRQDCAAL